MKTYFVTVATFGSYEDRTDINIYVGEDYIMARMYGEDFEFPDSSNNWIHIEKWIDGKKVKTQEIQDGISLNSID